MQFNSKKSRGDRMMRSKSFDTQKVREIGRRDGRLSHLMDGNNKRCLIKWKERNAETRKN